MLWHVEGTKLHLLGSVHVFDTPLVLDGAIASAIDEADVLAFEANFEARPDLHVGRYKTGTSLSQSIATTLFSETEALWSELNFVAADLERTRPWLAALQVMNVLLKRHGFHDENGVDRNALNIGKRQGKSLFFLESIGASLEPFVRSPPAEQELFLSRVVQHTQEGVAEVASIVAAWKARDPSGLLPVVHRNLDLMPATYSAALGGRNRAWLPQLLRLVRTGKKTVAVVGALHMVGPNSIPSMLESKGYKCINVVQGAA